MKRIIAMMMSLIMLLALAVPAFADPATGSITVKNLQKDQAVNVYRILDMTRTATGTSVSYSINTAWLDFFNGAGQSFLVETNTGGNLNPVTVHLKEGNLVAPGTAGATKATRYLNITDMNVADFSKKATAHINGKPVTTLPAATTFDNLGHDPATYQTGQTGLPLGYYLVYPKGAAVAGAEGVICSLTSTNPDAEVNAKAELPKIDKKATKVNENDVSAENGKKVGASIGDIITFTVTGIVPDVSAYDTYQYVVTDKMSTGLTFNQDVVVKINNSPVTPTTPVAVNATNDGFTLTLTKDDFLADGITPGQNILITYSAMVNDKAVGGTANTNNAVLEYSNDPSDATATTTTPPDQVEVYTHDIPVIKVDGGDAPLAGAQFALYKMVGSGNEGATAKKYLAYGEGGEVIWVDNVADAAVKTSPENGKISFEGLAEGTYYIEETEAPDGFNKLTEDKEITVSLGQNPAETKIVNQSGTELPGTGGIGTTIFYVLGGFLMFFAAVTLVTRRRMKSLR